MIPHFTGEKSLYTTKNRYTSYSTYAGTSIRVEPAQDRERPTWYACIFSCVACVIHGTESGCATCGICRTRYPGRELDAAVEAEISRQRGEGTAF
jgi:hypothetical protein